MLQIWTLFPDEGLSRGSWMCHVAHQCGPSLCCVPKPGPGFYTVPRPHSHRRADTDAGSGSFLWRPHHGGPAQPQLPELQRKTAKTSPNLAHNSHQMEMRGGSIVGMRCCLQIQARENVQMTLLTEVLKLAKAFPVEMTGPNDGGMIVPHSLCSLTSAPPGAASDTSSPYLPRDLPLPQTTVL
ncbi:hypothetical protein MHYP_G00304500 [Metynnis hypsauchen]